MVASKDAAVTRPEKSQVLAPHVRNDKRTRKMTTEVPNTTTQESDFDERLAQLESGVRELRTYMLMMLDEVRSMKAGIPLFSARRDFPPGTGLRRDFPPGTGVRRDFPPGTGVRRDFPRAIRAPEPEPESDPEPEPSLNESASSCITMDLSPRSCADSP